MSLFILFIFISIFLSQSFSILSESDSDNSNNNAQFVWLTQTETELSPLFKHLRSRADTDVIAICWKKQLPLNDPERFVKMLIFDSI
jgi:hypothetical protein